VGVNTHRSNALVAEAVAAQRFAVLTGYDTLLPEQKYGTENSRIDLLLRAAGRPDCYVEVKNVTAAVTNGIALFPDAVSARGTKHLREMTGIVTAGARAVLVFCVQRTDVTEVRPADLIDPLYSRTLRAAIAHGVEAVAWRADLSTTGATLTTELPVVCP
jgi:sugar fermentation stimulation protein A